MKPDKEAIKLALKNPKTLLQKKTASQTGY